MKKAFKLSANLRSYQSCFNLFFLSNMHHIQDISGQKQRNKNKSRIDEGTNDRWEKALKEDKRISRTDGDQKLVIH